MLNVFEKAVVFATEAHAGQFRKFGDSPYILHPLEAAVIMGTMTTDRELLAAAVLHDTVEDTPVTSEQIEELFGKRVAALVASETEDKRPGIPSDQSWRVRKEESLVFLADTDDIAVRMLWLCDKLSNMRSLHRMKQQNGFVDWSRFNQSDPAQQEWYYASIATLTAALSGFAAWQEYNRLLHEVFERNVNQNDEC